MHPIPIISPTPTQPIHISLHPSSPLSTRLYTTSASLTRCLFLQEASTPKDIDLVPPLELTLRTKWPSATITWNGTDPLL